MTGGAEQASGESDAADLVRRIHEGDPDAETEFVRRYHYGVQVMARRYCRGREALAPDVAQEVLVSVLQSLRAGAVRDAHALPAYVRSAVVRTAQAHAARRVEQPAADVAVEELAGAGDPEEEHDLSTLSSALRNLLADMSVVRDREVLERFYLAEHNKDDICKDLGIDSQHFRRVLHRARERFRALLEQSKLLQGL